MDSHGKYQQDNKDCGCVNNNNNYNGNNVCEHTHTHRGIQEPHHMFFFRSKAVAAQWGERLLKTLTNTKAYTHK